MSEQYKTPRHGEFCWMELSSNNVETCQQFYAELFGWKMENSKSVPGFNYTEFGVNENEKLGGMFQMTNEFCNEAGEMMPSHWMAYVAVDNVDEAAQKVESLGGKVCVQPMDIPNVGRFCVIDDPSGAKLSLITMKQQ